jgi:hypothetical protein
MKEQVFGKKKAKLFIKMRFLNKAKKKAKKAFVTGSDYVMRRTSLYLPLRCAPLLFLPR